MTSSGYCLRPDTVPSHPPRVRGVPRPAAELGSIATTLDELARRIRALADDHHGRKDEETGIELDEIERSLASGLRRLERLVRTLGG